MRNSLRYACIFVSLLTSYHSMAFNPSNSLRDFCTDRTTSEFTKDLTRNSDNLMSFRNYGGIGNGGVCWWHSRFQRNSLYLTIFRPDLKKPSTEEAIQIIKKLRAAKEVVTIPGFDHFVEFSRVYHDLIQAELEAWQFADGAKFAWIRGLKGSSVVTSDKMKTLMDELYREVEIRGNIAYQKLQIKGITAHAWLVVKVKPEDNGYLLEVLDSNYPRATNFYRYRYGNTHFTHMYYGDFTPYLEETKEMGRINSTIVSTCIPKKKVANN